jgi:hypothetical protein
MLSLLCRENNVQWELGGKRFRWYVRHHRPKRPEQEHTYIVKKTEEEDSIIMYNLKKNSNQSRN